MPNSSHRQRGLSRIYGASARRIGAVPGQANLLACKVEGIEGEIFNIATGERVIINELIGYIDNLLATSLTPTYAEPRAGDVKHSLADISKAEKLLGYHPGIDFEEGSGKTIEKFLKSRLTNE